MGRLLTASLCILSFWRFPAALFIVSFTVWFVCGFIALIRFVMGLYHLRALIWIHTWDLPCRFGSLLFPMNEMGCSALYSFFSVRLSSFSATRTCYCFNFVTIWQLQPVFITNSKTLHKSSPSYLNYTWHKIGAIFSDLYFKKEIYCTLSENGPASGSLSYSIHVQFSKTKP